MAEQKTPLEVLINAKLAGTDSPSFVPMTYGYVFRTNEQAAERAIQALSNAGFFIVKAEDISEVEEFRATNSLPTSLNN